MISLALRRTLVLCKNVVVKILVDNGKKGNLTVKNNVRIIEKEQWRDELGLTFDGVLLGENVTAKSIHIPVVGTMHAKFLVVDGKRCVVSSNNVQDRPNTEMSVVMDGDICKGLRDVFYKLWNSDASDYPFTFANGDLRSPSAPLRLDGVGGLQECMGRSVRMMIVNRNMFPWFTNDVYTAQNCAWWTLMSLAKRSIFISTPTFNASHAIEAVYLHANAEWLLP
ncbi:unnamed protein product [Sphagnum tenellum]